MKQLQERDSRWRSARWKGEGWVQRAGVAALFDRPSRRCTELKGKIKTEGGIHFGDVAEAKTPPPASRRGVFILATSYSRTAYRRTTIGAAAFHCRVRNGNGWCHCAIVTRVRCRTGGTAASQRHGP